MFPYVLVFAVLLALTVPATADPKLPQAPDLQVDNGTCDRTTGAGHQTAPCPTTDAQSERGSDGPSATRAPEQPTDPEPSKPRQGL